MSTAPTPLTSSMRKQLNRIADLNLNEDTAKLLNMIVANPGLDDESREGVVDVFKQVREHEYDGETEINFGLPDYDDTDHILTRSLPSTPDLVEGLIKQGSITSFIGKSKTYKSWHLIRLGLCLANGVPWLGMKTKESKVLYLNPELIRQEYLIRLQAIAKELNVDTNHNFRSITLYRTDLGPSKILESLGRCLDKDGFEVIIIDSIYRLYTDDVDENSNSDVARFLGEVNKMAAKSGASVIFSHHSTKGDSSGKDSIDIASGAGSFGRWVDTAISTLRVGEEGDNKYCMKFNVRYFPYKMPVGFFANGPKLVLDPMFDVSETKLNAKIGSRDILELLVRMGNPTRSDLEDEVCSLKDISARTFRRHFDKLKAEGKIVINNDKTVSAAKNLESVDKSLGQAEKVTCN